MSVINPTHSEKIPALPKGAADQLMVLEALGLAANLLVIVAPHPDDDVLGCGALMAQAARQIPVRVIYVTDGAASHTGSVTYPPARLREVREREAARALRRLGVTEAPRFLRWPDGTVPNASDAAAAPLLDALRSEIPRDAGVAVALPWRRDPHCDHRAVSSLARCVLRERPDVSAFEYAVWLGIIGEPADAPRPDEGRPVTLASGSWLSAKRAAVRAHRSQLGLLVRDAETAFALPPELLAVALGPSERFVVPFYGAA